MPFGDVQWFITPPTAMANTCSRPPANTATGRPAGKFPPRFSIAMVMLPRITQATNPQTMTRR